MASRALGPKDRQLIDRILGYLNFSSGAPDTQFLASLNQLFADVTGPGPVWQEATEFLQRELPRLPAESADFFQIFPRPGRCCPCCGRNCCRAIRHFHADLLFHQSDAELFRPFFVGRACEAICCRGRLGKRRTASSRRLLAESERIIGYRPVAALESTRHEPYPHEWVRPIPLYIEGAGVEWGPHFEVVTTALEILQADRSAVFCGAAHFDPSLMEELACDPRAYDFDHPVNKRPNYHFGQWDPASHRQPGALSTGSCSASDARSIDGSVGRNRRLAAGGVVV